VCCSPTYKIGFSVGLCFKGWCGCTPGSCDPCHGPSCGGGCCKGGGCCGSGPACGYGPTPLDPWYTYYPYNAHFQTPAPTGYPYGPAPQTSGPAPMFGGTQWQSTPQMAPSMTYPAGQVMPCGYYQQAPSYWYAQ
jgi:hypothetical protein